MKRHYKLSAFAMTFFLLLSLGCDDNDDSNFGPSNNQQIFGNWRMSELIRSGCNDADNNLRRVCNDCFSLAINTDNSFQLTNDKEELITQGTFRLANETDITFDPGIFNTDGVSSVKYSLFTGALKFTYQDENTLCNVTESYLVKNTTGGGN